VCVCVCACVRACVRALIFGLKESVYGFVKESIYGFVKEYKCVDDDLSFGWAHNHTKVGVYNSILIIFTLLYLVFMTGPPLAGLQFRSKANT